MSSSRAWASTSCKRRKPSAPVTSSMRKRPEPKEATQEVEGNAWYWGVRETSLLYSARGKSRQVMDQSNAAPGLGIAGIMFTGIQTAGTVLPVGSGCTADAFHIKGVFFQPVSIDPVDQNPLPPILGEAKVQIPVSLPVGVRHDGEVSGREPGFPVNALGQARASFPLQSKR